MIGAGWDLKSDEVTRFISQSSVVISHKKVHHSINCMAS